MTLLLTFVCSLVFGCFAASPVSNHDPLKRLQQEVEQLKLSNEVSIAALKQTYDEKIANLEEQTVWGRNLSSQLGDIPIAFSARISVDMVVDYRPIIFNVVDLNLGDGYDGISGGFRPPVNGVYQFTIYGMPSVEGPAVSLFIKRNADILCKSFLPGIYQTGTCTAITKLTVEDTVVVAGDGNDRVTLRGEEYSGFTGFLLYAAK